jgi:hypothetical protein
MTQYEWAVSNSQTAVATGEEIDDEHGTTDENARAKAQSAGNETKRNKEESAENFYESVGFQEQQISEEVARLRWVQKRKAFRQKLGIRKPSFMRRSERHKPGKVTN